MEDQESSEETGEISSSEQSESQPESTESVEQEASTTESTEEKLPPFHEHPRFKELIEQNRAYKEEMDRYRGNQDRMEQQLRMIESQRSAPEKKGPEYAPILDRLKTIDPEFAKFQETLAQQMEGMPALQQRLAQYEAQQFQSQALSTVNNLYETNKVPAELRPRYEREIRALAYEKEVQSGKNLGIKDIEPLFKAVHTEYSKMMEDFRRKERASYVTEKKSDKTPTTQTGGGAITPTTKKIAASDEVGQVKWLAEELRAAKKQY